MQKETPSAEPAETKWITVRLTGVLNPKRLVVGVDARPHGIKRIVCFRHENKALLSLIRGMAERRSLAAFKIETGRTTSREEAQMVDFGVPVIGTIKRIAPHSTGGVLLVLNGQPAQFRVTDERLTRIVSTALQENALISLVPDWKAGLVVHVEKWEPDPPVVRPSPPEDVEPPPDDVEPSLDNKPSRDEVGEMFLFLWGLSCRNGYLASASSEHEHSAECIPWAFPMIGCDMRANFAALLLSEEFPQFADSLHIVTSSQTQPPFCCINAFNDLSWQYHVSVAVAVSNPDDMLVLDPSLFTAPVPKEHWKKRINALTATAADYDEMILSLSPGDVCELNTCRNSLMNEVVNHGWPPYRACP